MATLTDMDKTHTLNGQRNKLPVRRLLLSSAVSAPAFRVLFSITLGVFISLLWVMIMLDYDLPLRPSSEQNISLLETG